VDDLLESLAKGDDAATEEVFQRCEPLLRFIIRRHLSQEVRAQFDSQDIVQSIWADLVVGFRAGTWKFETSAELRAFLIRAAKNRLIDRARQVKSASRGRGVSSEWLSSLARPMDPSPSEYAQANDLWGRMLALCPPTHRLIVELKRDGLTLQEIAERAQMHPSSVRRVLYELARKLGEKSAKLA
jgi:RNA polymerase sigma-70 factor (ECF subfamily)